MKISNTEKIEAVFCQLHYLFINYQSIQTSLYDAVILSWREIHKVTHLRPENDFIFINLRTNFRVALKEECLKTLIHDHLPK